MLAVTAPIGLLIVPGMPIMFVNVLNEVAALILVGQYASILEIAEVPIVFWLLIWGAREKRSGASAIAPGHVPLT